MDFLVDNGIDGLFIVSEVKGGVVLVLLGYYGRF